MGTTEGQGSGVVVPVARGKVRDIYEAGDGRLLMVATDRISAFDVVLPQPILDKGRVLTACSLYWFTQVDDLVPNHLITADRAGFPAPHDADPELAGRAMLVREARVIPMECVVRGYLAGSGWSQYRSGGAVCGVPLPEGLTESAELPEPIFTPTTKADEGHDLPLTPDAARGHVGEGLYERLREVSVAVYERIAAAALARGIIVADTKFEFGFDAADGDLTLIDEVGTPDSSRFWPADGYAPGRPQPSFDKQYVRDHLDAAGWDHEPPPPELPADVVDATASRYREAYERISGEPFEAYHRRMGGGVTTFRFEVLVSLKPGLADPAGKAVEASLPALGWTNVAHVRVGKHITLDVDGEDADAARGQVDDMAVRLLSNPVIEDVRVLEVAER